MDRNQDPNLEAKPIVAMRTTPDKVQMMKLRQSGVATRKHFSDMKPQGDSGTGGPDPIQSTGRLEFK